MINKIKSYINLLLLLSTMASMYATRLTAQTVSQGWQALENQSYEEARHIFEKLAQAGDIEAGYGLGYLYWRGLSSDRDMQQAIEWLTKSAQKGHIGAQIGLGYIYLYGVAGYVDLMKAEYWYSQALESGSFAGYNGVAYVWAIQGENLPKALEYIDIALAFDKDDPEMLDTKGWILYQMKRYDQAFDFICKAVLGKPGDPELRLHLGDVYWELGLKDKARQEWQRAISFAEMLHLMTDESKEYVDGQGLQNWQQTIAERLQRQGIDKVIPPDAARYNCLQPIS
ncbi:MAG TPA: tetratricopeptide repeat protein [Alphaproteobacteria bacterium]|nr:tetratricopeptide repeat protein [Alphaproteobacteria bacterium]